jgi:hypothetical protein
VVVFTVIGLVLCALLCIAAFVVASFAAMSGRVQIGGFKPQTWLRHYRVFVPSDEWCPDPSPPALALCWTWWGAKRVASRTRGTRIQNRWSGSIEVAGRGWSEARNGYKAPSPYGR